MSEIAKSPSVLTDPVLQKKILETVQIPEGKIELQEYGEQPLVSDEDPSAAAAALFVLYGTRLNAIVDKLSAKQVKRLVKALCTYPLEDVFINKKIDVEKEAYLLANRMIESKFLITLQLGWEEEEKRKKVAEDHKVAEANKKEVIPEVSKTNNEGEKNV